MSKSGEKKPALSITESPSNFDNIDKMNVHELLTNIIWR
jgi:hypothetical protein